MAFTYTANPFSHQEVSALGLALVVAAVVSAAFLSSACERGDDGAQRARQAQRAQQAQPSGSSGQPEALALAGPDAGPEPVDPPAPAGNLSTEIEQFSTIDRCVDTRARLDPLVGDALEGIGYDTFLVDACRVLDAAKARDGKRCEAIEASSLRARCLATVAELAGEPNDCPWQVPARRAWGRDPSCVAIALRDPRLCAGAADAYSRLACVAVVSHDATACAPLPLRADQARCARQASRWDALAAGWAPGGDAKPFAAPAGKLRVDLGDAGAPLDQDLTSDLERGVVLIEERDGTRVVLGALPEMGPGFIAASPHVRATLGLELFVPGAHQTPGGARDARAERVQLVLPGRPALATPGARASLVVKVAALDRVRAGAVALTVEGELGDALSSCRLHVDASTFVRDVVKTSTLHDIGPLPVGTGAPMR